MLAPRLIRDAYSPRVHTQGRSLNAIGCTSHPRLQPIWQTSSQRSSRSSDSLCARTAGRRMRGSRWCSYPRRASCPTHPLSSSRTRAYMTTGAAPCAGCSSPGSRSVRVKQCCCHEPALFRESQRTVSLRTCLLLPSPPPFLQSAGYLAASTRERRGCVIRPVWSAVGGADRA